MAIQTRTPIFKIITIQRRVTVQLIFFTYSSRRAANRDCIPQHFSLETVIQEIFRSEKEKIAAQVVFLLCLDHKVAIKATCTWLLKIRVKIIWEALNKLHIILMSTCTACNRISILILMLISMVKIHTKCHLASIHQACIHPWFRMKTWAETCMMCQRRTKRIVKRARIAHRERLRMRLKTPELWKRQIKSNSLIQLMITRRRKTTHPRKI